jgi:peptide/nickel transport system permease protein
MAVAAHHESYLQVEVSQIVRESARKRMARRFLRDKVGVTSLSLCVFIVALAILAPVIAPYGPFEMELKRALEPPSRAHLMGTDEMGRDIFSRVLHGARISLNSAVIVVMLSVFSGTVLGTASGYLGGLADDLVMRLTDVFLAFPSAILAMAFTTALGPSVTNAVIALGLAWWPSYARLVRGQVLATRDTMYVEAARSFGATDLRIITRHILPNCMDPVFVRMTMTAAGAILMLAGLSFIGLGAQPPTPEWGLMLANARNYLYNAGWYPTLVGLAIFATVMSATLAGDAIQDAFEPTLA